MKRKKKSIIGRIIKGIFVLILILVLGIGFSVFYAYKIEPKSLKVNEYDLNANTLGLKVVQISDLELSENYTEENLPKIAEEVNKQSPDLIFFTGDMFSNFSEYSNEKAVTEFFSSLNSKYGKFAVYGNNDYGGGALHAFENILSNSGFELLRNDHLILITDKGKRIFVAGIDESYFGNPDIKETMKGYKGYYDYSIVLTHEPDLAKKLNDYDLGLILSGHTHGGQVNIPFVNISSLENINYDSEYVKGFYTLDGKNKNILYVNNGLGTSRIPVRFLVPPEIAVFNI